MLTKIANSITAQYLGDVRPPGRLPGESGPDGHDARREDSSDPLDALTRGPRRPAAVARIAVRVTPATSALPAGVTCAADVAAPPSSPRPASEEAEIAEPVDEAILPGAERRAVVGQSASCGRLRGAMRRCRRCASRYSARRTLSIASKYSFAQTAWPRSPEPAQT